MKLALLTTLLAVAVAVPASAQRQQTGMGFRLGQDVQDHRKVRADTPPGQVLMMTAECLASKRAKLVDAYLRTIPASAEEGASYEAISPHVTKCMPDMAFENVGNVQSARGKLTLSFDHSVLRGALAEAALRKADIDIAVPVKFHDDAGMYAAEQYHAGRSTDLQRVYTLGFAGCVMGYNAASLEKLFATGPGSSEERAVIQAMAPSFSECVMEGQTLSIQPSMLRNQIAEALYYAVRVEES